MEEHMKIDMLKQKAGVTDEKKLSKKLKKAELVVEPIDPKLIQTDQDKLCMQIHAYLVV